GGGGWGGDGGGASPRQRSSLFEPETRPVHAHVAQFESGRGEPPVDRTVVRQIVVAAPNDGATLADTVDGEHVRGELDAPERALARAAPTQTRRGAGIEEPGLEPRQLGVQPVEQDPLAADEVVDPLILGCRLEIRPSD